MNDPRKFKAPFIAKERIWLEADRLRAEHPAGRSLPVQILDLAADEAALDYIATRIAPKFGVSAEVIAKRLRSERLWPTN